MGLAWQVTVVCSLYIRDGLIGHWLIAAACGAVGAGRCDADDDGFGCPAPGCLRVMPNPTIRAEINYDPTPEIPLPLSLSGI